MQEQHGSTELPVGTRVVNLLGSAGVLVRYETAHGSRLFGGLIDPIRHEKTRTISDPQIPDPALHRFR